MLRDESVLVPDNLRLEEGDETGVVLGQPYTGALVAVKPERNSRTHLECADIHT